MIRPILLWPDPVLRQVCPPVSVFDAGLRRLAEDLLETMYAAPGRGLAAPQVGEVVRMFVMDVTWKDGTPDPTICINPVVTATGDEAQTHTEGCLSIPDTPLDISRPAAITLSWQDLAGKAHSAPLSGFAAICAQHELDHLDGIVLFDRIDPALRGQVEARFLA